MCCYLCGQYERPAQQTRVDIQIFRQPTADTCDMTVIPGAIQFFIFGIHFLVAFLITVLDGCNSYRQPVRLAIVLQQPTVMTNPGPILRRYPRKTLGGSEGDAEESLCFVSPDPFGNLFIIFLNPCRNCCNLTILDDEYHSAHHLQVFKWITVHDNHISQLVRLQGAQFVAVTASIC